LASSSLRRQLRVFLSKHFYRNKYDYRVEWLRFIETLSSSGEGADPYQNAVRATAQIVGSPGGVLYLPLEGEQGYAAAACWPEAKYHRDRYPVVPADDELFKFMRRSGWVVDLAELRQEPDAYQNVAPPEFMADGRDVRLLVPLVLKDDCLGYVLLAPPPPPFDLTYEDRDLLKTVGRHVATYLSQHQSDRKLAESRQFEAYHRLTAFVMHDLKNLTAQLSLLVANAEKHKRNPEFVDDAISTIANSTSRMQRLVDQLQRREIQSVDRRVSLATLAREACERCSVRDPRPRCGALEADAYVEVDPERLGMMIEHLIRNAQEATPASGSVEVSVSVNLGARLDPLGASGIYPVTALAQSAPPGPSIGVPGASREESAPADFACLTVSDNGAGMSAEFVKERLFRPFDTTKGSKGMGIGAYQVREYVRSVGGRVKVDSRPGSGTSFTLWLPLRPPLETVGQP
ncbi:MAG: PEP-CTERM system histidine kinase PrsK, partial [Lysobacterales bacterium]